MSLPLLVLAGLGLRDTLRADRLLGLLCSVLLASGVLGVAFFYKNHVDILHGRIFWGFRWVSWAVPMMLGLAAASFAAPSRLRIGLAVVWLPAALIFSFAPADLSTRPDYRGAARVIIEEWEDRDGIATIPMWGQRGPLLWYAMKEAHFDVRWPGSQFPKKVWLNPIHEQMPFETAAWNGHVDRLWIAVPDERMFGKPKFMLEHADRGIAWANDHLEPDGEWHLDHLDLYRFRRGVRGAWDGREPLEILHPQRDIRSLKWQEPNIWNCGQNGAFEEVRPEDPAARVGWRLRLRVPLTADVGEIEAVAWEGAISRTEEPGYWTATVDGGRCSDSPPKVRLTGSPN